MENFRIFKSLVGSHIYDNKNKKELDSVFPHGTNIDIVNNTIIVDYTNLNKKMPYRYKVVSYVDGRNISSFDCSSFDKLDNGNLKLTLKGDYEGVYRSLIFDTETGKPVSRIFDGMSDLQQDGTFIARLRVDRRRGKFDYIMKIDDTGSVVSDVLNDYTGEKIPFEDMVYDENKTFDLMEEKARISFIKAYSLEKKN